MAQGTKFKNVKMACAAHNKINIKMKETDVSSVVKNDPNES